uniref:glutathione S-transferase kappa 1-like n=1 Tax=Styela clava TaxID=7725 RepID=UPI001939D941|nr:glutathione S-transferase kappa 1-like [Styela clava]
MANGKVLVELFYDVLSPYSYFSFEVICRSKSHWKQMELSLRPALLGGIFKALGSQPPPKSVARSKYMSTELKRFSNYYNVPFKLPKNFGEFQLQGSLKAQRLLTAVEMNFNSHLEGVSRQVYRAVFVTNSDITQDQNLFQACTDAGFSSNRGEDLLNMITTDKVKLKLKESTREALDNGAFGMPTFFLHKNGKREMFFGSDRMFMIAHYLGESWPPPTVNSV